MNTDKQTIKYILYARKSSEDDKKQIQSIDRQKDRVLKDAQENNLCIVDILSESKSAMKPNNRIEFEKMLSRIESGEVNGILCWDISRLARNSVDAGRLSWMVQQGVIKSIKTPSKEFTPENFNAILFAIETSQANQFVIDLKKNSKDGMLTKAERGWFPSVAPIGYLNNKFREKGEKDIDIDPERFPLVRKMWDLMLTGKYSVSQIMEIAGENWGLRTLQRRTRGGKKLSINGLYGIFSNIFYTGTKFVWNGTEYEGKQEPMVTLKEFDEVQVLLGRKGKPRTIRKHKCTYNNILRCGECGRGATGDRKVKVLKSTGISSEYMLYRCNRKNSDHNFKCSQKKYINEKELERQVELGIERFIMPPQFKEWAEETVGESEKRDYEQKVNVLNSLNKALKDVDSELHNYNQMRARNLIDDEGYKTEVELLKKEKEKLRDKLRDAEKNADDQQENVELGFDFATNCRIWFMEGDYETKRDILFSLGSNLSLKDGIVQLNVPNWLELLVEKLPPFKEEYKKLELANSQGKLTENEKRETFASLKSKWLPGVGSNHRPIG